MAPKTQKPWNHCSQQNKDWLGMCDRDDFTVDKQQQLVDMPTIMSAFLLSPSTLLPETSIFTYLHFRGLKTADWILFVYRNPELRKKYVF